MKFKLLIMVVLILASLQVYAQKSPEVNEA